MSDGYWDGALWVFHADITRDGSTTGTDTIDIVPGEGDEMEVLYGEISHDDPASRQVRATISDAAGGNRMVNLMSQAITNSFVNFPQEGTAGTEAGTTRRFMAGPMSLRLTAESLAVLKKAVYAVVCRIRGGVPTVTVVKPADSTLSTNTNRVM